MDIARSCKVRVGRSIGRVLVALLLVLSLSFVFHDVIYYLDCALVTGLARSYSAPAISGSVQAPYSLGDLVYSFEGIQITRFNVKSHRLEISSLGGANGGRIELSADGVELDVAGEFVFDGSVLLQGRDKGSMSVAASDTCLRIGVDVSYVQTTNIQTTAVDCDIQIGNITFQVKGKYGFIYENLILPSVENIKTAIETRLCNATLTAMLHNGKAAKTDELPPLYSRGRGLFLVVASGLTIIDVFGLVLPLLFIAAALVKSVLYAMRFVLGRGKLFLAKLLQGNSLRGFPRESSWAGRGVDHAGHFSIPMLPLTRGVALEGQRSDHVKVKLY